MRALVQVVDRASVSIDGNKISSIEKGFLVFLGLTEGDDEATARKMAEKIMKLRVFEDENGKINLSLDSVGGEILLVSQFTLYGNMKEGNRPSFVEALRPEKAKPLYAYFASILREKFPSLQEGVFGADMRVELVNHGPTTLWLDSKELFK